MIRRLVERVCRWFHVSLDDPWDWGQHERKFTFDEAADYYARLAQKQQLDLAETVQYYARLAQKWKEDHA